MFANERSLRRAAMIKRNARSAPAAEFAQEHVGVAARIGDVVEECVAASLVGVLDDKVAEAEQALEDARRNGHILNVTERDVARAVRDQALIDNDL